MKSTTFNKNTALKGNLNALKVGTGAWAPKRSAQDNAYHYSERIKEQELVYNLFNILSANAGINNTLQAIVEAIPQGSQRPEEISARIQFNNQVYCSADFAASTNRLCSVFKTSGSKRGKIEVFYHPLKSNGGLLRSCDEAQSLIDCIVKLLQGWLTKKETESNLQNMLVHLEAKIEERTNELKKANNTLEQINLDVKDSINYANRIQRAVLPTVESIKGLFEDAFVLYQPKDTVSGDFYWVHSEGDLVFYVCGDCTGHGVPGALMSMVGNQLLDYIITDKKIREPEQILKEMDEAIIRMFTKGNVADSMGDGMALSLCVIDKAGQKVSFAGACNNAYLISNNEVTTLIASRHSIGSIGIPGGNCFNGTSLNYSAGDQLYMFTDGYPDQMGGPRKKKFLRKNLVSLIFNSRHLSHKMQKTALESYFIEWKKDHFQVDDVTVLGVKL